MTPDFQPLVEHPLAWGISGIFSVLVVASLATAVWGRVRPGRGIVEVSDRIRSWWVLATIFCGALLLPEGFGIVLLGFVSFLALKEYLTLIPTRRADRRVLFWVYLAIPAQFYWVMAERYGFFIMFIPVYVFLAVPVRMMLVGRPQGFLRSAGTLHWGLMITVFSLSHAAFLLAMPPLEGFQAGGKGLLFFLVLLTEANDVLQFLSGKAFGKHRIAPAVSPNKTWEGFLGGLAGTVGLALLLAPWFTPLSDRWVQAGVGLLIGCGGFFGDLTISMLKRDLGIKDTGATLPGHGGILDRVDSLTYTAPLFFHFIYFFAYPKL